MARRLAMRGRDIIQFAPSIEGDPIVLAGTSLVVTESLTLEGRGVKQTVIDGDGAAKIFVLQDNTGTQRFEILDVTLTNGNGKLDASPSKNGGAIDLSSQSDSLLLIRNSILESNEGGVGGRRVREWCDCPYRSIRHRWEYS